MSLLSEFQKKTGSWASDNFPNSDKDTICSHFREESVEFAGGYEHNDFGQPIFIAASHSPEKAADCLLLLLHHAHKEGYDLLYEAERKLEINMKRIWNTESNDFDQPIFIEASHNPEEAEDAVIVIYADTPL